MLFSSVENIRKFRLRTGPRPKVIFQAAKKRGFGVRYYVNFWRLRDPTQTKKTLLIQISLGFFLLNGTEAWEKSAFARMFGFPLGGFRISGCPLRGNLTTSLPGRILHMLICLFYPGVNFESQKEPQDGIQTNRHMQISRGGGNLHLLGCVGFSLA